MVKGTKYVTIIREPSSQWESAFSHFEFRRAIEREAGAAKVIYINRTHPVIFDHRNSSSDAIKEFLRNPNKYHENMRALTYLGIRDIMWNFARNNQIFDLGLHTELQENDTLVNETIDRLEQEMALVIINEYFDESLLVLKKMLCWTYEDILYLPKGQRVQRSVLAEGIREKIRLWNKADVLLYDRFNKTLWKRIREYGPSFSEDLLEFRRMLNETFINCVGSSKVFQFGRLYSHIRLEYFPQENSSLLCTTVVEDKARLFARVFKRQNPKNVAKIRN